MLIATEDQRGKTKYPDPEADGFATKSCLLGGDATDQTKRNKKQASTQYRQNQGQKAPRTGAPPTKRNERHYI